MSYRKLQIEKAIEELQCQMIHISLEREALTYNLENQPRIKVLNARVSALEVAVYELEKLVA